MAPGLAIAVLLLSDVRSGRRGLQGWSAVMHIGPKNLS